VTSCQTNPWGLRIETRAPSHTGVEPTATDAEIVISSSEDQQDTAPPPPKSRRPEGFPEAGQGKSPYQPPPQADDSLGLGVDEHGMIPEIMVDLTVEVEDLNADLVTNDPQSDTPQGMSPSDQMALDSFVPDSQPSEDAEAEVLHVVPSTQPVTLRTPPRRVTRRQSDHRVVEQYLPPPPPVAPTAPDMPAAGTSRGRGILRLRAPPKVARTPAVRRRPPPSSTVPPPLWTFNVPPAPRIEFRAETPIVIDPLPESGNRLPMTPDIYQDVDEDLRPLTSGSWGDIVEKEEQAAAVASTTTLPVVTVAPTASVTSSLTTPVNVVTTSIVTTAISPPIMSMAVTTAPDIESVVGEPPIVVTATVAASSVTTSVVDAPVSTMVTDVAVDSPTTTALVLASAAGAG